VAGRRVIGRTGRKYVVIVVDRGGVARAVAGGVKVNKMREIARAAAETTHTHTRYEIHDRVIVGDATGDI